MNNNYSIKLVCILKITEKISLASECNIEGPEPGVAESGTATVSSQDSQLLLT